MGITNWRAINTTPILTHLSISAWGSVTLALLALPDAIQPSPASSSSSVSETLLGAGDWLRPHRCTLARCSGLAIRDRPWANRRWQKTPNAPSDKNNHSAE